MVWELCECCRQAWAGSEFELDNVFPVPLHARGQAVANPRREGQRGRVQHWCGGSSQGRSRQLNTQSWYSIKNFNLTEC